ncbi:hypothetical protein ASPZODRAFT_132641 [Penicilliopsis zonata CBS 506.65]|uniref:DUF7907 domain-containing protein n=1 Tax=Penicilliopsis zonata CBS 506.65 TaxID=1073090 RepID=A0A1L9SHI2_9EURO|nr:hypothetical protein ASPZODRAFT_132641 [Penicilliopsis zonata CBS 506.65]OJJ46573.1 hypothetical protein ASPZODRAFT_132641 [Penicilliopsis zonata CBS 506.65]
MYHLFSVLASLALATASPLLLPRAINTTQEFLLKTTSSTNDAHNNLYVEAYHTGAGLNDAVLTSSTATAAKAFLNETYLEFDLGTPFSWSFSMGADTNYAAWEFVEINAGYGTTGFSLNDTGVQWSEADGFGGWLVCDWWHGAPQLFWLYRFISPTLPSSCSTVDLVPEYI